MFTTAQTRNLSTNSKMNLVIVTPTTLLPAVIWNITRTPQKVVEMHRIFTILNQLIFQIELILHRNIHISKPHFISTFVISSKFEITEFIIMPITPLSREFKDLTCMIQDGIERSFREERILSACEHSIPIIRYKQ